MEDAVDGSEQEKDRELHLVQMAGRQENCDQWQKGTQHEDEALYVYSAFVYCR